ncbi:MAG: hypothetical protein HUU55_10930 [Myxococcales bacterium]|nr:hypothetical protein [Myxococcales bacterium]
MNELLETAIAYPTVVFTILLGVLLVYWTLVIIGALSIETFHVDTGVDGTIDGAASASGDAAAESFGAESTGTAEIGDQGDGGDTHGGTTNLLEALGLTGVPITVSLSFLVLWSWLLTIVAIDWTRNLLVDTTLRPWAHTGIAVGSIAASIWLTGLCIRPLRRVFQKHPTTESRSLVGAVCQISTLRVDSRFGQASVELTGANLLLPVRCLEQNQLTKGSEALIIEFDETKEVFLVVPMDHVLTSEKRSTSSNLPSNQRSQANKQS